MPLIPDKVVFDRAWVLLEASTAVTSVFALMNRVKGDVDGWALSDEQKIQGDGSDAFPRIRLDLLQGQMNQRAPQTFNRGQVRVNYGVPVTVNVDITVLHKTTKTADQLPIEHAIKQCFMGAGSTLGIVGPNGRSWVTSVELNGSIRRTERTAATGRHLRTISRQRLVVTGKPMLKYLLAP